MKEVTLDESTAVPDLGELLECGVTMIVRLALTELGRMTTIHERFTFEEASVIAGKLGYVARRRRGPQR